MALKPAPLGKLLLARGLVTRDQLDAALKLQHKSGGRLGDVLVGEGILSSLALHQAVAEHYGAPFVNLLENPPDDALLDPADLNEYLALRALPHHLSRGNMVLAACDVTPELAAWAKERFPGTTGVCITAPFDVRHVIENRFADALTDHSLNLLWRTTPGKSARSTLNRGQRHGLIFLLALLTACAVVYPLPTLHALVVFCQLLFAATMLFKALVFFTGRRHRRKMAAVANAALPDDADLPVYTVLVPMYREAKSLPGLLRAMDALDYPRAKLDIKLVLEADDVLTLSSAMALKPKHHFEIIRVPPSSPRTKPKACNYALRFARGDYVTIYDADDRPDPQQLKKAVGAFRRLPPDVVCLQARLNYYNARENLLTRLFSLEYQLLFDFMLPGLEALGIPIPLGGTSNHIDLKRLHALGEWDPYNVTEDADLGVRLAVSRCRTAMIDSATLEESPVALGAWLRQRSRWIKGYMQTWLVHMREPLLLYRELGFAGFFGFQFFVGLSCFTFLVAPLLWLLCIAWLAGALTTQLQLPGWLVPFSFANLVAGFVLMWVFAFVCLRERTRWRSFVDAAFVFPYYWLLHSLASYKALWQLAARPHFWEKTTHGMTKFRYLSAASRAS